jgi:hypothetical protein
MRGVNIRRSHRARRRGSLGGLLLLLAFAVGSTAQERLGFFACGEVRFFGEACPPPITPDVAPAPPPERAPPEEPLQPEPLFTPETVAPTTPPLVLRLLQAPTEDHARAFLAWQQARLHRLLEVQALLKRLHSQTVPLAPEAVPRP